MTVSVTRIFGFICTFAFCELIFPPATVPPDPNSFTRKGKGLYQFGESYSYPVVILKRSPSRSQQYNNGVAELETFTNEYNNDIPQSVRGYYSRTVRGKTFSAFEGVPYAEPPVGPLTFKVPHKKVPWRGQRSATNKAPMCMQMDPTRYYNVVGKQDCLYLNVYSSHKLGENEGYHLEKLPVIIWIHGGGFYHGSGNYYGPSYLLDRDIVLVTINYRLGPMGFLSTGDDRLPGNLGLKDQAMAIEWVYENIESFAGDKNRITLSGQSAGAASTHFHMMSRHPIKTKIFAGISQSGSAFSHWALPRHVSSLTNRLARMIGCPTHSSELVPCLESVSPKTLVSTQYKLFEWMEHPSILFGPVIEHNHPLAILSDTPDTLYKTGQVANVPWITGVTKDEGDLFSVVTYLGPLATRSLLRGADSILPTLLIYPKNDTFTTKRIKEFYLSEFKKPSLSGFESLGRLSQMIGDLFFYAPFHKSVEYHLNYTTAPVYGYFLSYKGQHGVSEKFLVPPSDWGVMHMDDIQYLFNSTEYFHSLSPTHRDYTVVDHITSLWSNFAHNRIPSLLKPEVSQRYGVGVWDKMDLTGRRILDINFQVSMIQEPYQRRIAFWKSTPYY